MKLWRSMSSRSVGEIPNVASPCHCDAAPADLSLKLPWRSMKAGIEAIAKPTPPSILRSASRAVLQGGRPEEEELCLSAGIRLAEPLVVTAARLPEAGRDQ